MRQAVTAERASRQAGDPLDPADRADLKHMTACREGGMCTRVGWRALAAERVTQRGWQHCAKCS